MTCVENVSAKTIRRVVPDITSERVEESRAFHADFLGFDVAMDLGWIVTFASPDNPTAQINVVSGKCTPGTQPHISVEVSDVDATYAEAMKRGLKIVYPITNEAWGVRRFFVADPNGVIVNVMCHQSQTVK